MAAPARPNRIEKLAGRGAVVSAAAVGLAIFVLPAAWLDAAAAASGVAVLSPLAAAPPGAGARVVPALGGGALIALVVRSILHILFGAAGVPAPRTKRDDGTPVVRRADAHPDAPPRRPLSAAELGGSALPSDLDTPLSAMDPGAIPRVPRQPVRPVAPLASGERLQVFALAQPVPAEPAGDHQAPSIDALMRRLGSGRAAV